MKAVISMHVTESNISLTFLSTFINVVVRKYFFARLSVTTKHKSCPTSRRWHTHSTTQLCYFFLFIDTQKIVFHACNNQNSSIAITSLPEKNMKNSNPPLLNRSLKRTTSSTPHIFHVRLRHCNLTSCFLFTLLTAYYTLHVAWHWVFTTCNMSCAQQ
jgi:hypothetical protein